MPFTHNATFTSGGRDQHWHKDDNGPFNGRKQRHHQAVQIEMLYYPQAVREDMGPTATVPYSHYWTFNHEENHDNFAGADHLDFAYQLSGMEGQLVSGPDSQYDPSDIVHRRTAHDVRLREAVTNLKWPLVQPFEAAPAARRQHRIVLAQYLPPRQPSPRRLAHLARQPALHVAFLDLSHHGPSGDNGSPAAVQWNELGVDPLTQIDRSAASDDVTSVWRYHHHWMQTGQTPPPRPEAAALSPADREAEANRLFAQLLAKGEEAEPARIGAAYKLASIGDSVLAVRLLGQALSNDRESVRRAATYGLIAVGEEATDTLIAATNSPIKWVRKAGVYGLGDASPLNDAVLQAVATRLRADPSVYVRAVAAGTLGCLGRRAIATGVGQALIPACLEALVQSLGREENRLAMDRAQGRSIKFVRPTDECDVCEGGGVDFGLEQFKPVRSAVRENALWSLVILCSHGTAIVGPALESTVRALQEVIRRDENAICVGLAMDALAA